MKIAKIAFICIAGIFCAVDIFSQSRPVATMISAQTGLNKSIEVQWEFPKKTDPKISNIKLYRTAKPISSYKEIEGLEPIANVSGTKYTDIVPTAGEYFYAVVAVTNRGDYGTIIPGMNATTEGVRAKIPASSVMENSKIETNIKKSEVPPLPIITPQLSAANSQSTSSLPLRNIPLPNPSNILGLEQEQTNFSDDAMKSVEGLGKSAPKKQITSPYFFEDDMFAADGGDDYILFETLRSGLVQRKYGESVELLSDFLSVNRTFDVTKRAEFYLGESFYFCGDYENAIRCFLSAQEAFPELTKQWLDSSLDLLEIEF